MDHVTDERVGWVKLDDVYDVAVVDGEKYAMRAGQQESDFVERFPADAVAIRAVFADMRKLAHTGKSLFTDQVASGYVAQPVITLFGQKSRGQETINEALDRLRVTNPKLRRVLCYHLGDLGVSETTGSWLMMSLLWTSYEAGAAYPRGGSSVIASAVRHVVEGADGKCVTSAPVASILVENGIATGVRLVGRDIPLRASKVISCVGALNTFGKLLQHEPLADRTRRRLAELPNGESFFSVFVALRGAPDELKLTSGNVWVHPSPSTVTGTTSKESPVFISFPCAKDMPSWKERFPSSSVAELLAYANYDEWAQAKADGTYEDRKAARTNELVARFVEQFPLLKDKIEWTDAASPLTFERFLGSTRGAAYGLPGNPPVLRARREWLTACVRDIPGLYLGGQDVLSNGILGAMMGGITAACAASSKVLFQVIPLIVGASDVPEKEEDDVGKEVAGW